jgi:aminoglycoside 3-N-acetyltransferase
MSQALVTQQDIIAGLRRVGLAPGEVVFVHSSLSAFGHVQGGADAVVEALLECVGLDGTVVVPTFTWEMFHHCDADAVVFDLTHTPSNTGRITEVFRRRSKAIRSEHLCHSVAAIGPHSREVMGEGVRSFGAGSSFDALYRLDARCLLLGVGFNVCSALHAVEETMQVPYRDYRDFAGAVVIQPDGRRTPSRSVEYLRRPGYRNHFDKMRGVFEAAGILQLTRIGDAPVTMARLRDIIDVTRDLVAADSYYLVKP